MRMNLECIMNCECITTDLEEFEVEVVCLLSERVLEHNIRYARFVASSWLAL